MAVATETLPDTRARILDAAFEAVATHGLSRFTMDDVARAAGISRQTVYRYHDSKDALIVALVEREEEAFIEGVRRAFEATEDLEGAMEAALLYCLKALRQHPLLDRLLASEPNILLPYLTTRGGGVVARAREAIEELVRDRPAIRRDLVHRAADLSVRAVISYALTPSDERPQNIAREAAHIMATALTEEGRP